MKITSIPLILLISCRGTSSEEEFLGFGTIDVHMHTDDGEFYSSVNESGEDTALLKTSGCSQGDRFSISADLYADDISHPLQFAFEHPAEECSLKRDNIESDYDCVFYNSSFQRERDRFLFELSGYYDDQSDSLSMTLGPAFEMYGTFQIPDCALE
jgi:hypothetical protein